MFVQYRKVSKDNTLPLQDLVDYEAVHEMSYLEMCCMETLRLYPPVPKFVLFLFVCSFVLLFIKMVNCLVITGKPPDFTAHTMGYKSFHVFTGTHGV